jgi:DNA ligase 1
MILPKLFSRTTDGSIQEWSIEIEGSKFRTISGKQDGKLVISKWTDVLGKNAGRANATTPEDQALKEAQAKWQKKIDSGYRQDQSQIDDTGLFEPMLAEKWEDYKDELVFPVHTQPKLDGIRCVCTAKGMFSRNGKPFVSAPHVLKTLAPLFEKDPTLVLDGELYCDKYKNDFNEISSLVRKSKPSTADLAKSEEVLQYWAYDIFSHAGKFSERTAELSKLVESIAHRHIVFVETHLVPDLDRLNKLYEEWLEKGMEGQMIRIDALYQKKRTKYLLKRKEFEESEFTILGVFEGSGNRSGTAGWTTHEINGKPFKSNIKGSHKFTAQVLADAASLIGKQATIRYFKPTPDGIPRFPFIVSIRDYE